MSKFMKMLGASFVCVFSCAIISGAFAADTARSAGAGRATQVARMPAMPVVPINTTGNTVVDKEESTVTPQPQPEPQPEPQCLDGGVRNSEYTVENCMDDILTCINNGALPGGLNDLFNEDMRNSIVNGMGLCTVQVEKCVTSVRRDCKPVYNASTNVWVDFNSRKVQPEYYNFVLRKTGLTPNQAENTCLLLDRNTYGPSFSAVANDGTTTAEYNNQVGAYNGQMGNVLIKTNPLGAKVNEGQPGVDGQRGHYARWDATTATCYVRVAAYNKDKQIKNSWLFGALGNDEAAEVWRPAGDTFSCNKDLFGFSLMNDTKTTAVVGVGGGTLLGAGIGALAGNKRAFTCDESTLRKLKKELSSNSNSVATLNRYLSQGDQITSGASIDMAKCKIIEDLYIRYVTIKNDIDKGCSNGRPSFDCYYSANKTAVCSEDIQETDECNRFIESEIDRLCENATTEQECKSLVSAQWGGNLVLNSCTIKVIGCRFKSLASKNSLLNNLRCENVFNDCATLQETEQELKELESLFADLGEKTNVGSGAATGAAIGAGAGGVATAITALVEKNNINCRVGDGLNTVAFGKSHSIDSLKDFYVKWNLHLPDTVSPTSTVVDCQSWRSACGQYTDADQCKVAVVNYRPKVNKAITTVYSACEVAGSVCVENGAVAKSYGACK